ncbi:hypothetical protein Ndes2526A_g05537 [Nannochloris sp. 'desiccata']
MAILVPSGSVTVPVISEKHSAVKLQPKLQVALSWFISTRTDIMASFVKRSTSGMVLVAMLCLLLSNNAVAQECSNFSRFDCRTRRDIQNIYQETGLICNVQWLDGNRECNSFALESRLDCRLIPQQEFCDEVAELQGVEDFSCEWINDRCRVKR